MASDSPELISWRTTNSSYSFREVSAREAQDGQWRRHSLRDDLARLRELRRSAEDLPCAISRGELQISCDSSRYTCILIHIHIPDSTKNLVTRGDNTRPNAASSSGTGANSTTSPGYEGANHNVISNPMDPSVEAGTDFAYGHPGPGDY